MSHVCLLNRDLRLDGLAGIADGSMDGCLCDPPYGLRTDGRALTWDDAPTGSGFMGKAWDNAVPGVTFWREVLRVLKPGASVLAFGGTRTYHRLACAIEDAGFETRDSILCPGVAWIHGQGFPKSLDIAKAIDRAAGVEPVEVARGSAGASSLQRVSRVEQGHRPSLTACQPESYPITEPSSPEGIRWSGYGTALKPAWEPIVWAMKPLDGTFAENALREGVAGINVPGGRIGWPGGNVPQVGTPGWGGPQKTLSVVPGKTGPKVERTPPNTLGRWPANVILCHLPGCVELGERSVASNSHHPGRRGQGAQHLPGHHGQVDLEERRPGTELVEAWACAPDCPVAQLDRQSGEISSGFMAAGTHREGIGWRGGLGATVANDTHADSGGASRFFYCAKVSPSERAGSKHPTLKPIDLCRYLATLILPPARSTEPRRLLVPFAGEGSEIIGALQAGWEEITGIEGEREHIEAGARRIRDVAPLIYSVDVELGGAA